jgi:ribulose-phosphate 3-epimerase
MVKIAPSILSADFSCLAKEIEKVKEAEWLHIDIMDGQFVPNITIGPLVVKALRKITNQFFDVHLMIKNPERFIKFFADAGANLITIHIEACENVEKVIDLIKQHKCKVGISIKPATNVEVIEKYLDKIDLVLVMTVEPGFGGQKFMPEVLPKIKKLARIIREKKLKTLIEVDGGINLENCEMIAEAGADILVAGSAIFNSEDPKKTLKEMQEKANKVLKKN